MCPPFRVCSMAGLIGCCAECGANELKLFHLKWAKGHSFIRPVSGRVPTCHRAFRIFDECLHPGFDVCRNLELGGQAFFNDERWCGGLSVRKLHDVMREPLRRVVSVYRQDYGSVVAAPSSVDDLPDNRLMNDLVKQRRDVLTCGRSSCSHACPRGYQEWERQAVAAFGEPGFDEQVPIRKCVGHLEPLNE